MKSQDHVALLLPDLNAGGAERVMLCLAREFLRAGCRVTLLLGRAEGGLATTIPEKADVVELAPRSSSRIALAFGMCTGLARFLRRDRPEALLSTLTRTNLVACLAHATARSDSRLVLREASTLQNIRSGAVRAAVRSLYGRASAIVAVSKGIEEDLARQLGACDGLLTRIPNPVDIEQLIQLGSEPIVHPWMEDPELRVIVAAGRLVAAKDFATLIQAFSAIARADPYLRLMILGEGPLRANLETLTAKLGMSEKVQLPGWADNPYPYVRRAALFVLSSRWEGLPNVLIEAMALGTPVVATDCHSGPRELLEDGRFGALVPVGSAEALAEAIARSLSAPIRNPPNESLSAYEPARVARKYLELLLCPTPEAIGEPNTANRPGRS